MEFQFLLFLVLLVGVKAVGGDAEISDGLAGWGSARFRLARDVA